MARPNSGTVQPWPIRHVCDDGKVRNLAVCIRDEWADHPDVVRGKCGWPPGDPRGGDLVWMSHRVRAARSLGRSGLEEVAKLAGRRAQ
jgi:hypothetical protein